MCDLDGKKCIRFFIRCAGLNPFGMFRIRGSYPFCLLVVLNTFFSAALHAQSHMPQPPQTSNFTPVYGSQSATNYPTNGYSNNGQPQVRLGGTAQNIMSQQQSTAMSPHRISAAEQQRELAEILSELRQVRGTKPSVQLNVGFGLVKPEQLQKANIITARYYAALDNLNAMLEGRRKLSLSEAYYTVEQAYGQPYVTKAEFKASIEHSAAFIRQWMQQQNMDVSDNNALNLAIQKFMGEALTVTKPSYSNGDHKTYALASETHRPFFYDYKDYQGKDDHRDFFVTKCIATGGGQCSSMPGVYLCLAEALGAKASLSFAPQHSFIKWQDKSGAIRNYEATSNWEISDEWYKDDMFISPEAVRSGIYLDTMTKEQMVAQCIYDLAVGYTRACTIVTDTGAFLPECLRSAKPYFPKYNNLAGLFLYSVYIKMRMELAMMKSGITDPNRITAGSEAASYMAELAKNEAFIKHMGYRELPADMYEQLLKEHEFKNKVQQARKIDGKTKRSLFTVSK